MSTTTFFLSARNFRFFPEAYQDDVAIGVEGGFFLATGTIVLTFILELFSLSTVRGLLKTKDGKSLYLSAIFLNFLNHYIYGIPIYTAAIVLFCTTCHTEEELNEVPYTTFALRTLGVLITHCISYYSMHKAFHTSPNLYKYHRYHHRFNTYVPPVSANAVSGVEYLLAYVVPFALGAFLARPAPPEMALAVCIVSGCNLLIHTPALEELSEKLWPVFVTTHGHIEHHRKLTVNYAAPTLNLDWCIEQINSLFEKGE